MKKARLTLVGAGPGDPDLISIKGAKALAEADVILYDALAHPDVLQFAPASVIKIFVGKKVGVCQFAQEDINNLIVENAQKHGHVVRLKGGDPFIFGRGHEEIIHAQKHDIETEIIPGISSSISVPELQGIPLTRRGINESFWVVTGTTRNHELSSDIYAAAKSNATVVILMGMTKLLEICSIFSNEGKSNMPVAVIQNGTTNEEKVALGYIHNISEIVKKCNIGSPAIIVIGEVVTLHPAFAEVRNTQEQYFSGTTLKAFLKEKLVKVFNNFKPHQ